MFKEIKDFLTNNIQPEYRVGNINNFRKIKKDVLQHLINDYPITFYWIRINMGGGFGNFW
jgi:hypothetical protein